MPLVHGRIGGEKVEILLTLRVPDRRTRSAGEDDGERVIVVGCIRVLGVDCFLSRGGVIGGKVRCAHGGEGGSGGFESAGLDGYGIVGAVCLGLRIDGTWR